MGENLDLTRFNPPPVEEALIGRALKYLTPAYPIPMPFISQNFQESLPEFFTRRSKSLRRIHDSSKSTSKAPEIPLIERGPRGLKAPNPLPPTTLNFQR
ncbi:hypothetical protein CEXT_772011 [Caerostris extrusa]|uniref:Uncharacterized protein n=1 Tax=Caerostris extrusa TaxID=172846 RepID=A0AAV4MRH6_CAEEX|nr:hypothetical protein CEXT_772011 [Caerostris extrusa]